MKCIKSYGKSCALWFDIFIAFQNIASLGFRNYCDADAVFVFDNIDRFRFRWKMWKWKWRNLLPMKPMVFIPISSRRQEHLSYLKINQKLTLLKNSRKSARRLGSTLSINTFVAQPTAQDEANRFGALLTPCLLFTTWQPVHAHLRVKISAGVLWTIVTDELLQKNLTEAGKYD